MILTFLTLQVYPRVCGGTIISTDGETTGGGLSPRVRGNRHLHWRSGCYWRSIPACAGEPVFFWACCWVSGVYPRVCGGTAGVPRVDVPSPGLSPRVRGNHQRPN